MARRIVLLALIAAGSAAAAPAATPPPTETPQDAVAMVKRILKRTQAACHSDWSRISAVGFEGDWEVEVKMRASEAGEGTARWTIGDGWPVARNKLARALAHGCPAD